MTGQKISELPQRVGITPTDEFPNLSGGINYRTPISSLVTLIGDGSGGGSAGEGTPEIDGVEWLRLRPVVHNELVYLRYHTTPSDYGAGYFRGQVGSTGMGYPFVDDNGVRILPTGGDGTKCWMRVYDNVTVHVGWFGAKCDHQNNVDDYIPISQAFKLFTDGRTLAGHVRTGAIDFGAGCAFSQPLIFGGSLGASFKFLGNSSMGRGGQEKTTLKYIGPATDAAIVMYGVNESAFEDLNIVPGNLALNGVLCISDNTYNHTTTHAITAGTNVVVTPSGVDAAAKILWLQIGVWLGVDAGGDNFEIIYITAVDSVAGTFTADFKKNHASGVQLGGGTPSSGMRFNRVVMLCPGSPVYTKLSIPHINGPGGGTERIFTPVSMTGIKVGSALWIGNGAVAETVYVKSSTATTFTANAGQLHPINSRIMLATSAVLFGNRLLGTVQVSEISMSDVAVNGGILVDAGGGVMETTCYAGIRQIRGGNVKNITIHHLEYSYLKVVVALEDSSGQYLISGAVGAGCEDTFITMGAATMTVLSWEDESYCYWIRGGAGSSHLQATFIGCTIQGACNRKELDAAGNPTFTDQMAIFTGNLAFIGCHLGNTRIPYSTYPVICMPGIRAASGTSSATPTLALINCNIPVDLPLNPTTGLPPPIVTDVPLPSGGGVDVLAAGTGRVTMLGCTAGVGGTSNVIYPTMLPRQQNTAPSINPPSIAAGAVDTVRTMTVAGASLGDLVEASFSLDLQGASLRAWVSAADTVSYQFGNPTAGAIDLGSGTVKCRVTK